MMKLAVILLLMGFLRKMSKCNLKCKMLRISIFLKLNPWISSQIYRDPPGIFSIFCVILNFELTPVAPGECDTGTAVVIADVVIVVVVVVLAVDVV